MRRKRSARRGRATRKFHRAKGKVMPKATVSMEPETHQLVSCPGGYAKLRRMSFGELMASQDLAYQVQVKNQEGAAAGADPEMGVSITRAAIVEFQFRVCIIDHNLQHENGQNLNFNSASDVHLLDSNVGQEISDIIEQMHRWDKKYPNLLASSENGSSPRDGTEMAQTGLSATSPSDSSE